MTYQFVGTIEDYRKNRSEGYEKIYLGFPQQVTIQSHVDVLKGPPEFRKEFETDQVFYQYRLQQLSGCCGVAVLHDFSLNEDVPQRHGIGTYLHEDALKLIKDSGYSKAMCTTKESQEAMEAILRHHGWVVVYEFKNRRTRNNIKVWMKDIQ